VNAEGRPLIEEALREHGLDPVGKAVANFVFAEVGEDSRPLFERLLQEGVIVRPTTGFGAPGGIRVTVGTPDENAYFREALGRVLTSAPT
ncbi:MAG TPA: aminotransferase class I/II-fold pyridoxal phosphate-dependent enzyme, partial [Gaiellaceae bacterium]|nr:aminotransferase class I/II-fold pyridoxal phosphate-dependent enzyme [Gaiellaceae bacterium]